MTPADLQALIEKMPFKKKASPNEMLLLLLGIAVVFFAGVYATLEAKQYFDDFHKAETEANSALLAAIGKVDKTATEASASLSSEIEKNTNAITSLQTYKVSNADMQDWTHALERQNRPISGNALIVPDFPRPSISQH